MKEFLNELARLWWIEVGTELTNPISEKSIRGLKKILEEEYEFDSEVIDYIIEVTVKTPNNFHLGDMDSNMVVGDNDTAVSAHLYTDTDDEDDLVDENEEKEEDEKEDSTDKERPDSGDDKEKGIKDISKGALTAYEKEKLKKEAIDDKLLKTKLTNPTTGNKNQVSTLLGKKKSDPAAYKVGKNFLGDKGVSDDEIEKQSDSSDDTSSFEKSEPNSKENTDKKIKISERLSENLSFIEENYDKVRLKTGGGSNSPSVQDVKDLKEFTEKRMAQDKRRKEAIEKGEEFNEEPYVHPSIVQRKVSFNDSKQVMDYFEKKLDTKEFGKLLKKFSAGGAVPRHLTKVTKLKKGDEGYPGIDKNSPGYIRGVKVLQLYLKNDCKSPVTGNPLPLSHMEPDHRLPFTTAESDIVDSGKYPGLSLKAKKPADGNSLQEIMKKRKDELTETEQKIVKDLEPLQAKYDDPDTNMDLMSGPVNQFKSDLIDNELLNSIRRKLAENPAEKKLQNEYKTLRKKLIREHHADKVSRGDNPPYNEYDIRNADSVETNAMMKAHNYYHPDAKTITELEGGDPSKGIPADPQYYDKVKAFWKEKGVDLPENKEDIDFSKEPFNKTMTIYVQAGRSRGGAKRRSKGDDHNYMIEEFKKYGYFGSSLEDDKGQERVIDDARKSVNKQLDTKRMEILKVQLDDPNLTGRKRENRQKELDALQKLYSEE
jgi:hypothetical protein|tara:strand:- start:2889 stop:5018 length:2130 start_codon:yes stop_codon:yes gene_type:complete